MATVTEQHRQEARKALLDAGLAYSEAHASVIARCTAEAEERQREKDAKACESLAEKINESLGHGDFDDQAWREEQSAKSDAMEECAAAIRKEQG